MANLKKYIGPNRLSEIFSYIKAELDKKVTAVSGKGLSANDYTTTEKNKLAGISSGAEVNVQADWDVDNTSSDAYILHKPTSMPASDVSSWAKQPNKPSYAFSEITSKPTTIAGYGITDAKITNGVITLGSNSITPLTQHQDISGKADKATTLAGYGITDAKIASGTITLGANTITPLTQHQSVTDNNPTLSWGTKSKVATIGSTAINVTMPSNPNTDTKVTSVGNHYAPAEDSTAQLDADASSSTAATWNSTSLVTGVTVKRDAKGHVTGLAVDSIKMPANPNTNTTYTFAGGTNKFTVTPSGGTAQDITITPSIANNITGSGTSGYLAKFNGGNTITSGPQLGSGTTTYLRNDGSWATPPDNNTTYTIATGDSNGQIKVTPSSGSAYNVDVKGLGSRAYDSTEYIPKLTYEYNKEISFGSTGKLLIGKFPCYDSNVTIEINATTSITYHATAVLATQNINDSHGGTIKWDVYGDEADTITPNLYLYYPNDSRYIEIYFSPASWSKNLIHIRCVALRAVPTNICENISEIPSTATTKPTNMYKAGSVNYATSAGSVAWSNVSSKPTTISGYGITDAKIANGVITLGSNTITPLTSITSSQVTTALGYTPYNSTNPNGYITSSGSCASATKATQDGSGNVISTTYMKKGVDRVTAGQKSGTDLGVNATAEGSNNTASGRYSHAEGQLTVASEYYAHAEGYETTASGSASHAEGRSHETFPTIVTKATGMGSHAEGIGTLASGLASHAEGYADYSSSGSTLSSWKPTTASGEGSHAEGIATTASATASHAEGLRTTAAGQRSHAEGWYSTTTSTGTAAHAEGEDTEASELAAHAEGYSTVASGYYSHAEGNNTIAASQAQHVEGKYNVEDANGTYAHIIGGGSSSARKNIITVDWSGQLTSAADLVFSSKPLRAVGSRQASATNPKDLLNELRFSSGCMGSYNQSSSYTKGSTTLSAGWYNYIWIPHRFGGVNWSANGDNCNYGTCILCGMTMDAFAVLRLSGGDVGSVHKWY